MSIVKEREALKQAVMDRKEVDLTDRIYFRTLINEIIDTAKATEEWEMPSFLQKDTVKI